jgi:hypothetical protein
MQIAAEKYPTNTQEADKRLSKMMFTNTLVFALAFMAVTIGLQSVEPALAHKFPLFFGAHSADLRVRPYPSTQNDLGAVYTSWPSILIDILCGGLLLGSVALFIRRVSILLLGFGRQFVLKGQWEDASLALHSFNQSGQHFLDQTGEAHYLLAIAYQKLGKLKEAGRARDFVLVKRANSEWSAKLSTGEPPKASVAPPTHKGKRRRF